MKENQGHWLKESYPSPTFNKYIFQYKKSFDISTNSFSFKHVVKFFLKVDHHLGHLNSFSRLF